MISLTTPAIGRDYAQPDILCPTQARHGIAAPCKLNLRRMGQSLRFRAAAGKKPSHVPAMK
jgi:hypothetical protein